MKVGIFTDSYPPLPDGVATSVDSLVKGLKFHGHRVSVVAPQHPEAKNDSDDVTRILALRLLKRPEFWMGLDIPQASLLKLYRQKFDLIHGHSGAPVSLMGWRVARFKRIPFIGTYHTIWRYYAHYFFMLPEKLKPSMFKLATTAFTNRCDAVIAPSNKVKRQLLTYGVKKPVKVIPSGIDLDRFITGNPNYLKDRLNLPRQSQVVLSVGRLDKEKSFSLLIKAFHILSLKSNHLVLVIAGEGLGKRRLAGLVRSLNLTGKVFFIGRVPYPEMASLYHSADVFAFASRSESQGLVVIEALASGLPVVCVNDPAYKPVIKNYQNGFLTVATPFALASKISLILENRPLNRSLGLYAPSSVAHLSYQKTSKQVEALYEKVLKGFKKPALPIPPPVYPYGKDQVRN